jgi:hypothetical protein
VEFVRSDDRLARVAGSFDLIHSYIVFQHIPCRRGEAIAERLLRCLAEGGVGVLHFTYFKEPRSRRPRLRAFLERAGLYRVACAVRGVGRRLRRLLPGRSAGRSEMQMNPYNLNALLLTLQRAGVRRLHLEYTDHGDCYGALLFFQKQSDDRYLDL